jgi:hypothetical protein
VLCFKGMSVVLSYTIQLAPVIAASIHRFTMQAAYFRDRMNQAIREREESEAYVMVRSCVLNGKSLLCLNGPCLLDWMVMPWPSCFVRRVKQQESCVHAL